MQPCIKLFEPESEFYFQEGCYIIEQSNSLEDPDVSIARARVEPGRTTRWHALEGITERYVIIEGEGLVEVGEEAPQEVAAGDVVIIPPRVRQRVRNTGNGDLIFLAICSPRFTGSAYRDLE